MTKKNVGIVRKLDELGRITIPIELRRALGAESHDELEIFADRDKVVIKKYEPSDIFTGETKDLYEFHGKLVSRKSIVELAKLAGIISQDEDV